MFYIYGMDKNIPYYINILGLVLDIGGVLLIFFFAVPKSGIEIDKNDTSRMIPFVRPNIWGKYKNWGLFCVILGFILQVVSSLIFISINN